MESIGKILHLTVLIALALVVCSQSFYHPQALQRPAHTYSKSEWTSWSKQAQDRGSDQPGSPRQANLFQIFANTPSARFSEKESILSPNASIRYIKAIDEMESRYPFAVPNADLFFKELTAALEQLNVQSRRHGNEIKAAAKRFLTRVQAHQISVDFEMSGLSMKGILALVWAGVSDPSTSSTEGEFESKVWELTQVFAQIQRGHNDPEGWIDYLRGEDNPICIFATYKKVIEVLPAELTHIETYPRHARLSLTKKVESQLH